LYERVITHALTEALRSLDSHAQPTQRTALDTTEAPLALARHVHETLLRSLRALEGSPKERVARQVALCNRLIQALESATDGALQPSTPPPASEDGVPQPAETLLAVARALGGPLPPNVVPFPPRPEIPLAASDLLVNARGEPGVGHVLGAEIPSADRIDLLCAFIKWNGFRVLEGELRDYLESGRPLRVITTTYVGATERRAIDLLAGLGAEVKVSYETRTTRLHAKAWLFHRDSGFSTAYVGSSNLSRSALLDGLEWNVRLSQVDAHDVLEKFRATFESYWEDTQFEAYDPERDADRFDEAIAATHGTPANLVSPTIEVRPYPYQVEILDALRTERERHGRHRNLVVAATGTGKTIIAALDYRRLCHDGHRPSLLFVAHRKEILWQSLQAFRAVLRDGAFGELYVDGHRPEEWTHVFASIQSLTQVVPDQIAADAFDVVIVDEFHHAEAKTYRQLLEHLQPRELLGLTATPERSDGESVVKWFGDRIAAELRLWEALERGLLSPFQYFGVSDNTDLSQIRWTRGGYDIGDLENLYTANDARVGLVLKALQDKVADVHRMRALGFCVSVAHAQFMARKFSDAGLRSVAVSAETSRDERAEALQRLRARDVNVVFAVDLLNEGVDLPEVDTVLFLRPTESATVFQQQLGRGLRLAEGKDCLTALDFVGQQHRRFRFDLRYRSLTGATRKGVEREVEAGFPYLPAGCTIQLDRVARETILQNIRGSLGTRFAGLIAELKRLPQNTHLAGFLRETGLETEDLYRTQGWSWTRLLRAAGRTGPPPGPLEADLARGITRLLHHDDPEWLALFQALLNAHDPPDLPSLSPEDQRRWSAFRNALWGAATGSRERSVNLAELWECPALRQELCELFAILEDRARHVPQPLRDVLAWGHPVPLSVHASYSRDDILAAFGLLSPEQPHSIREGVKYDRVTKTDIFFVTLEKSEKHYSPSTRYRDYAMSPDLFHWESQSQLRETAPTARRYINHRAKGTHVILFVRQAPKRDGRTQPYVCLGPAEHQSHSGERPIAFVWRLLRPMPADLFSEAKVVVG
jgi:superfamily II DNA or RNA helicase